MDDNILEEEVALLQLTPEVLAALSRTVESSSATSSLKALAEHVLYGDAVSRQQLDIGRLQQELEGPALEANSQEENRPAGPFLRRLHWARLLRLLSGETLEEWASQVKEQRQRYRSLRQQQQLSASQLATLDPQRFHPLAATAGNPWSQRQVDEELQEEIWRDIERTYPERQLFNKEGTRRSLQRVLFTWAKSNSDVSYKQGMNEILAVLYLACAREAVPSPSEEADLSSFSVIFSADPADIEADAYCLFDGLMTGCCMRFMYLPPQKEPLASTPKNKLLDPLLGPLGAPRAPATSAVLHRCNMVFDGVLCKADHDVYLHLNELGVEPQLFLLRWLRLLFSREFHIEDTLLIWDALMADAWLSAEPQVAAGGASGPAAAAAPAATAVSVPARTTTAAARTGVTTAGTAGAAGSTAARGVCTPEECAAAGGASGPAAAAAPAATAVSVPARTTAAAARTGVTAAGAAGAAGSTAARGVCTPEECAAAASKKLPLVDYFAIAMLKFIRQQLLESDYSSCLRRLLKFPPIESVQCLVALSLAVRNGTTLSTAAATAPRSSSSRRSDSSSKSMNSHSSITNSSSSSSNNSATASPAVQGALGSPTARSRFIQQPPPLTPTIISKPQLQHEQHGEISKRQAWPKESAFATTARTDSAFNTPGEASTAGLLGSHWPKESAFATTARTDSAFNTPGEASTAGLLGSHIDAMRQALTSVAEGCNDLPASVTDVLVCVARDLCALKSVLEGAPYSASVFKLNPGAPNKSPLTLSPGGPLLGESFSLVGASRMQLLQQ
ncbi:hypothetical protein, conserved [Eimeria praecox]|uniref:Rab-GAP TBC domain-containing protein n=1 Tax=Eimeria praecox TaxID=51316 RepID=U6G378_9EIME|nr:hypothetical protein, conserved [Eimeria praecox]